MGHAMGVDSGHCLSKQQNKCSMSITEVFEQFIDHSAPVIKPHSFSFSNYQANNAKQFYLNMELHTKELQIGMNSAVATQLCLSQNVRLLTWRTVVIQQNKRNHCIMAQ